MTEKTRHGTSQLVGVGMGLKASAGGLLEVTEIVPNGPVYKSNKIKLGDVLKRVNGKEVGMTVAAARDLLMGPPGTAVSLSMVRREPLFGIDAVQYDNCFAVSVLRAPVTQETPSHYVDSPNSSSGAHSRRGSEVSVSPEENKSLRLQYAEAQNLRAERDNMDMQQGINAPLSDERIQIERLIVEKENLCLQLADAHADISRSRATLHAMELDRLERENVLEELAAALTENLHEVERQVSESRMREQLLQQENAQLNTRLQETASEGSSALSQARAQVSEVEARLATARVTEVQRSDQVYDLKEKLHAAQLVIAALRQRLENNSAAAVGDMADKLAKTQSELRLAQVEGRETQTLLESYKDAAVKSREDLEAVQREKVALEMRAAELDQRLAAMCDIKADLEKKMLATQAHSVSVSNHNVEMQGKIAAKEFELVQLRSDKADLERRVERADQDASRLRTEKEASKQRVSNVENAARSESSSLMSRAVTAEQELQTVQLLKADLMRQVSGLQIDNVELKGRAHGLEQCLESKEKEVYAARSAREELEVRLSAELKESEADKERLRQKVLDLEAELSVLSKAKMEMVELLEANEKISASWKQERDQLTTRFSGIIGSRFQNGGLEEHLVAALDEIVSERTEKEELARSLETAKRELDLRVLHEKELESKNGDKDRERDILAEQLKTAFEEERNVLVQKAQRAEERTAALEQSGRLVVELDEEVKALKVERADHQSTLHATSESLRAAEMRVLELEKQLEEQRKAFDKVMEDKDAQAAKLRQEGEDTARNCEAMCAKVLELDSICERLKQDANRLQDEKSFEVQLRSGVELLRASLEQELSNVKELLVAKEGWILQQEDAWCDKLAQAEESILAVRKERDVVRDQLSEAERRCAIMDKDWQDCAAELEARLQAAQDRLAQAEREGEKEAAALLVQMRAAQALVALLEQQKGGTHEELKVSAGRIIQLEKERDEINGLLRGALDAEAGARQELKVSEGRVSELDKERDELKQLLHEAREAEGGARLQAKVSEGRVLELEKERDESKGLLRRALDAEGCAREELKVSERRITELEMLRDEVKGLLSEARDAVEERARRVQELTVSLSERELALSQVRLEYEELKRQLGQVESEREVKMLQSNTECESLRRHVRQLEDQCVTLQEDKMGLNNTLSQVERDLMRSKEEGTAMLKNLSAAEDRTRAVENERDEARAALQHAREERELLQIQFTQAQDKVQEELLTVLEKHKLEAASLEDRVRDRERQIQSLENELEQVSRRMMQLEEARGADLERSRAEVSALRKELIAAQVGQDEAIQAKGDADARLKGLLREQQDAELHASASLAAECQSLRENLAERDMQVIALSESIARLQGELAALNSRVVAEEATALDLKQRMQTAIAEESATREQYKQARDEVAKLNEESEIMTIVLRGKEEELKRLEGEVAIARRVGDEEEVKKARDGKGEDGAEVERLRKLVEAKTLEIQSLTAAAAEGEAMRAELDALRQRHVLKQKELLERTQKERSKIAEEMRSAFTELTLRQEKLDTSSDLISRLEEEISIMHGLENPVVVPAQIAQRLAMLQHEAQALRVKLMQASANRHEEELSSRLKHSPQSRPASFPPPGGGGAVPPLDLRTQPQGDPSRSAGLKAETEGTVAEEDKSKTRQAKGVLKRTESDKPGKKGAKQGVSWDPRTEGLAPERLDSPRRSLREDTVSL